MSIQKKNLLIASLLGSTAVALFLFAAAAPADAGVVVRARVHTPIGTVHVTNGPTHSVRYREAPRRVLPVRRYLEVRITAKDRQIARRLARYTGTHRQELLDLKRQGYTWQDIGRWLDLSPRVVSASYHQKTWHRFLDRQDHLICRDTGGHRGWDRDDDRRWNRDDGRGRGHR